MHGTNPVRCSWTVLWGAFFLAFSGPGCGGDGAATPETPLEVSDSGVDSTAEAEVPPTSDMLTLSGIVVNSTDEPVAGAAVRLAAFETSTGTNGRFLFDAATGQPRSLVVSATGYLPAERLVDAAAGRPRIEVTPIRLVPITIDETVDGAAGASVAGDGSLSVSIPAGAFTGTVRFTAGLIPVGNALLDDDRFPAPLPRPAAGQVVPLFGVILEAEGQQPQVPLSVTIAYQAALPAGVSVPVGRFDSESGKWVDASVGTTNAGGTVAFQVDHLSTYAGALPALPSVATDAPEFDVLERIPPAFLPGEPRVDARSGAMQVGVQLPPLVRRGERIGLTLFHDNRTLGAWPEVTVALPETGVKRNLLVKIDSDVGHVRIAATSGAPNGNTASPSAFATEPAPTALESSPTVLEPATVEVAQAVPGVICDNAGLSFEAPVVGKPISGAGAKPVATPANVAVPARRTFPMGIDDRRASPFGAGWHLRGLTHLVQPQCDPDHPAVAGEFDLPAMPFGPSPDLFLTNLNDKFPASDITPAQLATQEIHVAITDAGLYAGLNPLGSIWRISSSGDATLIAGGPQATNTSGEGTAKDLKLGSVVSMAPGPAGSGVLVATPSFVTLISPDGTAKRLIGVGGPPDADAGGGPPPDAGGAPPAEGMNALDAALTEDISSFVGGLSQGLYVFSTWSHGSWTVKNGVLHELRTRATHPHGIIGAIDGNGTLYYTVIGNPCVYEWVDGLTDPELFPTCLNSSAGAPQDGDASKAVVGAVVAMAADGSGGLWMLDGVARAVRYRSADGFVSTVSSEGTPGVLEGAGGPLAEAKLGMLTRISSTPSGELALSAMGNLFRAASPNALMSRGSGDGAALRKQDDGTWIRVLRDGTREVYDTRGLLVSRGKAGQTPLQYVYDAWTTPLDKEVCGTPAPLPRLQRIELAAEPLYTFDWNGDHITGITDAASRKTSLTWAGGSMTEVSLPGADSPVSFKYDVDGRILEKKTRGPSGSIVTWSYTYDRGHVVKVAVPGQGDQLYQAMVPAVTIPETAFSPSRVTTTTIELSGSKPVASIPSRNGPPGKLTFTPRAVQVEDPAGNIGNIEVDAFGRPSRVTQADGTVLAFARDESGRLIELRNELTQDVWRYSYDASTDRISQRIDPAGAMTQYLYDTEGRLVNRRDPSGTTTIEPVAATGVAWGLPHTLTDALGRKTEFAYDARGNLATLTAPGGVVTTTAADVAGNVVTATEASGIVHTMTWDALQGETKHQVGDANAGHVTTYQRVLAGGWTDIGSLVPASAIEKATDGMGRTWTWSRDAGFQVVHATTPGEGDVQQVFDSQGRKASRSTSDGSTEHYEFDATGRLKRRWFSGPAAGLETSFEYDHIGRVAKLIDPNQTETRHFEPGWGWSSMSVLPSSSLPATAGFEIRRARIGYGVLELTSDPDIFWIHTDYDGLTTAVEHQIVNQAGSHQDLWKVTLDATRNPSRIDRANGVATTVHYDAAGRADEQDEVGPNSSLQQAWTFDAGGRPSTMTLDGVVRTYSYDAQGRLAGCSDTGESYTYDKAGARASANGKSYTRDARGRLSSDGTYDYTYDDLGRRTSRVSKTNPADRAEYVWGPGGLLKEVRAGAAGSTTLVASFDYDGSGRRIRKVTTAGTWLYGYLPDSDRLARMVEPTGQVWNLVHAGRQAAWTAAVSASGEMRFTHVDSLGRLIALSDESGNVEGRHESCYGERLAPVVMTGPSVGMHGMPYDTETGLYVAGPRYYDPVTGEFLSPDPNGIEGGADPWGYAGGNPLLRRDPNGRLFFVAVAAVLAGLEIYHELKSLAQGAEAKRTADAYKHMTDLDSDSDLAKGEEAHERLAAAAVKGGETAVKCVKKGIEAVTSPPDADNVKDFVKDQVKDAVKDKVKETVGDLANEMVNGGSGDGS